MDENRISPRFAFTITNMGNEKKLREVFESVGVSVIFSCLGAGTAPSAIMDIFGFSGREKVITAGILPKENTHSLFAKLDNRLSFSEKGRGIAFTLPLTSLQSRMMPLLEDKKESIKGDNTMTTHTDYVAILASVKNGYSEDVIEAARRAGAMGGTIIKGSREGTPFACEQLGISEKSEQEYVLILTPKDQKKDIMTAITEECGLKTDAHGVVVSFALDEVFGI